jgi:EAL domain-containing protein (putative c-di-GMP-specific phosphodiesterase class I)
VPHAIEQGQFYLNKQRIKSLSPTSPDQAHYELLIRYRDDEGHVLPPNVFIPAAEKHSVITLIDQWVLSTALARYQEFFPAGDTVISINLSGVSISDETFVNKIVDMVRGSSVDPRNICFEITETAAISQLPLALDFIHQLRALGVQFALDDFGSGASFFGYLKQLPIDYLKIDGSLVKNIVHEPTDRAIVESICAIARIMNMKTIAEFVENAEIEALLSDIGVDYVQGYGVHMPELC